MANWLAYGREETREFSVVCRFEKAVVFATCFLLLEATRCFRTTGTFVERVDALEPLR